MNPAGRSFAILLLLVSKSLFGASGLTLDRAVDLALTRNERAAAASARVEAADARVDRARSFFFPDVTFAGTYTRRAFETTRRIDNEDVTIQSKNALNASTVLSSTLFNARAFPLYRQARLERESTRLDSSEEKRLLAFEAADAFVITLSLEQVLDAARRRSELARTSLDDARARFEAELVSSNDVTRAELELATAERELTRARGNVETAYLELGNLVNEEVIGPLVPPEELLQRAASLISIEPGAIAAAGERRLDLQSSRKLVEALEEFAKEPAARFIPNLTANGQHRYTNEQGLSGRENDGSLSLTLTWNAFDGGEWRAERAERRALARAARMELAADSRTAEVEARTALTNLASEQAALSHAGIATSAARRNAEETNELYRNGLASALELADSNFRLFDAEVAEARARYQLTLSFLDLRTALGFGPIGDWTEGDRLIDAKDAE